MKPTMDEENKAIFIDRDPKYFQHILDYLRTIKAGKECKIPSFTDTDYAKLVEVIDYLIKQTGFTDCQIITKNEILKLVDLCG